jgi:membrane dipeptidase
MPRCLAAAVLVGALVSSAAQAATLADARALQNRLITLDTHMDSPMNFARPGWDIMQAHTYQNDLSQLDYPRMVEGGLDGGFFAVFTPQGPRTPQAFAAARDFAIMRAVEIREMVARHSDHFALALRADDASRIKRAGKRIVFISMENSYPLGKDLTLLKTFYDLGVRMAGPVHFTNNDLADSATDPKGPEWHGLSPLGRQFVAKANRLGIILDASHASDEVFDQMLALSTAPIVLSHSGVRAVFNHPRNIGDARIKLLAAKGGVIQVLAYSEYMTKTPDNPARDAAMQALRMKYGPYRELAGDRFKAYLAERHAIEARYPLPRATIEDFMAHLLHALKLVGPDHVGIGLDMDGGGGVKGLQDVSDEPEITRRLLEAGYSDADIAKIWGANILRVMRAVEAKSDKQAIP